MSDVQHVAEVTDRNHLAIDARTMNVVSTICGVVGIPIPELARIPLAKGIGCIRFRNEHAGGHAAAVPSPIGSHGSSFSVAPTVAPGVAGSHGSTAAACWRRLKPVRTFGRCARTSSAAAAHDERSSH